MRIMERFSLDLRELQLRTGHELTEPQLLRFKDLLLSALHVVQSTRHNCVDQDLLVPQWIPLGIVPLWQHTMKIRQGTPNALQNIYTYTYIQICIFGMYMCVYLYLHIHVYVYIHVILFVYISVCICTHMCRYTCICVYIYTHTYMYETD